MIALITAALAPAVALLSYFFLKNKYERNTAWQVMRSFIMGVLLVFPIMVLQYALRTEGVLTEEWQEALAGAALLEEFFKWFLLYFLVYRFAEFRTRYDGIVYGVALSLGFATAENVLYLMAVGIDYAFGRAVLPVSSHALFGVVMGYYFGCARFPEKRSSVFWIISALVLPIVLHAVYDLILLTTHENILIMMVPFMFFLWWFALSKTKHANKTPQKKGMEA
ncbi:glutamic-type intramembrane protease PrsW [Alteribacillus sp. HJP-4]|uniref:glutamic-type intramembrane protease PrsW n=1 Tax=Alteribacillus sp. HJP-4 TaxID=2775394 RepID=UPI0035CCF54C